MTNWRWYHLVLLWIGCIIVAAASLAIFGSSFSGRATSGSGGIGAVGAPLWLLFALLVLLLALLIATVAWVRAH